MKKISVLILVMLVASLVLAACASPAAPTTAPQAPQTTQAPAVSQGTKTVKVCLSWNEKIHSLIQAWQDYAKKYGDEVGPKNGIKFEWVINVANGDPTQQANNIQDCINQKVDIIVARAQDSGAIGASIDAAKKAGIPFVTFDREASNATPTAHVGEDSFKQALSTATAFAKLLKDKNIQGQCIELEGDLLDQNAVNRHNGWKQVEEQEKAWTTIAEVPTEWKPEKFYSGALDALQAHPEANCMYAASDFAFSSVEQALQAVNKLIPTGQEGHIWMAAEDVNPQGYEAMKKGYIDVGTTWDAWSVAVQLDDVLVKIAKGEPVDAKNLVSGRLATPTTVEGIENLYARDYKD